MVSAEIVIAEVAPPSSLYKRAIWLLHGEVRHRQRPPGTHEAAAGWLRRLHGRVRCLLGQAGVRGDQQLAVWRERSRAGSAGEGS